MESLQQVYDRGDAPWYSCARCTRQSNYRKWKETGGCPHCGDNREERLKKEKEQQDKLREKHLQEYREKLDKREANRLAYKPSKRDIALCKRIISEVLNSHLMKGRTDIFFHGWLEFVSLYKWNEDGRYANLEETITYAQILRAMKAGKHMGWITSKWTGIGVTPFAGAGRRTMEYTITDKGKTDVHLVGSKEVN